MDNKTLRALRLGLASVAFAGGAQAAEITIFEHARFGGAQLTLRGYMPDIAHTGFANKASSIVVTSGRWELCTDADFKGTCAIFTRGEYPELDRTLNDRFSSAREVGSYSDRRGGYGDYGRGKIQLFDQRGFAGGSIEIDADASTFRGTGFNNRAASMVVTQGTWELCTEREFGGTCRIYAPGRYADLGYGMAGDVSSARLVRSAQDAPTVIGSGRRPPPPDQVGRVILYSEPNLQGQSLAVAGAVPDLARTRFDDSAESMIVESGTWTVCHDPYFRGECREFGPGRYNLGWVGFDRTVSSLRPSVAEAAPADRGGQGRVRGVELFSEQELRGKRFAFERDVADLADSSGFNDSAESLIIHSGTWELCTDARFGGSCAVFRPGQYPSLGGLTKKFSSARRVQ